MLKLWPFPIPLLDFRTGSPGTRGWLESKKENTIIILLSLASLQNKSLQVSIALYFFMGPFGDSFPMRLRSARELGAFKFMILLEIWKDLEVGI